MGEIAAMGKHNERTRDTPNADPERLADNVRSVGSDNWVADAPSRLDEATNTRFHPDAVLGIEVFMGTSPEFFAGEDREREAAWIERSMAWLRETFGGERNVVGAVLHRDETTSHIQALVAPLNDRDRLSAWSYLGGPRDRLSDLQDRYHAAVWGLGLERGVRGSVVKHQTVREWYAKIQEPTPTPEIVKQHLLVAQVRGIDLEGAMRQLGGAQDRYDKHKWQVAASTSRSTGRSSTTTTGRAAASPSTW